VSVSESDDSSATEARSSKSTITTKPTTKVNPTTRVSFSGYCGRPVNASNGSGKKCRNGNWCEFEVDCPSGIVDCAAVSTSERNNFESNGKTPTQSQRFAKYCVTKGQAENSNGVETSTLSSSSSATATPSVVGAVVAGVIVLVGAVVVGVVLLIKLRKSSTQRVAVTSGNEDFFVSHVIHNPMYVESGHFADADHSEAAEALYANN
jgi:hypothetical protein